jgi:hypothetical protein
VSGFLDLSPEVVLGRKPNSMTQPNGQASGSTLEVVLPQEMTSNSTDGQIRIPAVHDRQVAARSLHFDITFP